MLNKNTFMKKILNPIALISCFLFCLFNTSLYGITLPHQGRVLIDETPFHGLGEFRFALVSDNGQIVWSQDGKSSVPITGIFLEVRNGFYSCDLGSQKIEAMAELPVNLFSEYPSLKLRIWFNDGVNGLEQLGTDQPLLAAPYALALGQTTLPPPGTITREMLSVEVINEFSTGSTLVVPDFPPNFQPTPGTIKFDGSDFWGFNGKVWISLTQNIDANNTQNEMTNDESNEENKNSSNESSENPTTPDNQNPSPSTFDPTSPSLTLTVASAGGLEMIWVKPGTFMMGDKDYNGSSFFDHEDEKKYGERFHSVTLTSGYYLGKFEVTQGEYKSVMSIGTDYENLNPSNAEAIGEKYPVNNVSNVDVIEFLRRLNEQERLLGRLPSGWEFSIPTEPEWEFACRAGTQTRFFWGDEFNASKASAGTSESMGKLFEVGFFDSNAWGFHDMHGNVHEMTLGAYVYPETSITDPKVEPAEDWWYFRRGGSFYQSGNECSSHYRNYFDWPRSDIGFRLVLKKTN